MTGARFEKADIRVVYGDDLRYTKGRELIEGQAGILRPFQGPRGE